MADLDAKCNNLLDVVSEWLRRGLEEQLGVRRAGDLNTPKLLKSLLKEEMAELLLDALVYNSKQNDLIRDLRDDAAATKKKVIDAQATVILLQSELLESKNQQLQTLQTTVKSSVAETVKAEFVSYSAAAQKIQSPCPAIAPETLKSVQLLLQRR